MNGRHAVYFAPATGAPWWRFAAAWLGRDEVRDLPVPQEVPAGLNAQAWAALTAEPRRYGFHATLKAPFRLRTGTDAALLRQRLAQLAAGLQPVPLGRLVPVWMDGFVALVPATPVRELGALAARCVVELDDLRAPLDPAELARRKPENLDSRGRQLLAEYGYPHVLERFSFHLTLTGPVDSDVAGRLVAQLAPRLLELEAAQPLVLDRLCLFHEAAAGAPFTRVHEELLQ